MEAKAQEYLRIITKMTQLGRNRFENKLKNIAPLTALNYFIMAARNKCINYIFKLFLKFIIYSY